MSVTSEKFQQLVGWKGISNEFRNTHIYYKNLERNGALLQAASSLQHTESNKKKLGKKQFDDDYSLWSNECLCCHDKE